MLRDAFRGTRRFDDWRVTLGVPRTVLSSRLARLTRGGILVRSELNGQGGAEYRLTAAGLDLWTLLIAIWAWETRWAPNPGLHRHRLVHLDCGQSIRPVPSCTTCHEELSAYVTRAERGPGAGRGSLLRPASNGSGAGHYDGAVVFSTQTTRILSDRWTSALVAQAFRGAHTPAEFAATLDVAEDEVRDRLQQLVELELLETTPASDGSGNRYRLTAKGIDHYPISLELIRWGDQWLADASGPPVIIRHTTCGGVVGLEWRCSHCGGKLERRRVRLESEAAAGGGTVVHASQGLG